MFNFITFRCEHCSSVIFNLPKLEFDKLDGHKFMCGCCGHHTLLLGFESVFCSTSESMQAIA